jgi:hypothetical protein
MTQGTWETMTFSNLHRLFCPPVDRPNNKMKVLVLLFLTANFLHPLVLLVRTVYRGGVARGDIISLFSSRHRRSSDCFKIISLRV